MSIFQSLPVLTLNDDAELDDLVQRAVLPANSC